MPALRLFGRFWLLADDDFVLPFASLAFFDVILLVIVAASLGSCGITNGTGCADYQEGVSTAAFFLLGQVALIGCGAVLHLLICLVSSRGSVMDREQRKAIGPLLYIHFVLFLLQLGWMVAGGVLFLTGAAANCPCGSLLFGVSIATLVYEALLFLSAIIAIALTFSPAKPQPAGDKNANSDVVDDAQRRYFRTAFRTTFVAVRGSHQRRKEAMHEVADTFVELFGHLDLVASDFAVGFLLVRDQQCAARRRIRERGSTFVLNGIEIGEQRTQFVDVSQCSSEFELFAYFMQYANVAYGFPAYIVSDGCKSLCTATRRICCSCCSSKDRRFYRAVDARYLNSTDVDQELSTSRSVDSNLNTKKVLLDLEDTSCVCQHSRASKNCELDGVRLTLECIVEPAMWKNPEKEPIASPPALLYFSACDRVDETPLVIAYDAFFDKLVVSIRGTMSLSNVLTDANGKAMPVFGESRPNCLAHRGILRVALVIIKRLRNGVLDRALQQAEQLRRGQSASASELATDQNSSKGLCPVLVVGHSLGAGLAALVCALLREDENLIVGGQRRVEALAYSPPGGLVSSELSEQMRTYITSIVVGDDCVPRAGISQAECFRDDVCDALKASKRPKWKLVLRETLHRCHCARKRWPSDDTASDSHEAHAPSLLIMPGNIVHIMRISQRKRQQLANRPGYNPAEPQVDHDRAVYVARRASPQEFDRLLLSGRMLTDHLPYFVAHALVRTLTGQEEARSFFHGFQFA